MISFFFFLLRSLSTLEVSESVEDDRYRSLNGIIFCSEGGSRDTNILVFPCYMKVATIALLERFSLIAPKEFWLKSKQVYLV